MAYVDGFVVPVPRGRLEEYRKMAALAETVWREFGALDYVECLADDVPYGELTSFPRSVQATDDEVVVFSWIVYDSREQRDAVNARVMQDERFKDFAEQCPFDGKRMIWGGFTPFIGLGTGLGTGLGEGS